MSVEIKVPSVGESITEGTIARWLKSNGAIVKANEPVCELETDKATTEVMAPSSGRLAISAPEGQKVAIGSVIGQIEEGAVQARSTNEEKHPSPPQRAANSRSPAAEPLLSPAARQVAATEDIEPSQLSGSGRGGRIIKEDVLAHLQQLGERGHVSAPSVAAPPGVEERPHGETPRGADATPLAERPPAKEGRERRERMSPIRARIAERLLAAQQNAAILTTFNEGDLSAVMALRTKYKESFHKKHGVGLGFMSFFVKAAVEALRAFPAVNASIDGGDIVYHNYHDIGVAVSTEKGLMVPVLRRAEEMSFAAIEKGIAALAQKARDNKITVTDLQGGTFTITNGGIFGSLLSTPILNPPQSAILGMHAIQKRPVAIGDQVVIRPMMYLALSYDHRLIDGREAVSFLVRVKECIESPERLLLEV
ncbi:MAG TPA: 2-oxoglutarate dehydrogenase complex dihydrolipoyllysine-residue succinyltransferase [Gemmataceae bacterium]|nr:2-oxoglutarate dehydrogenase complex dihydrolipoyllysine-residue succinyltransferase [Gemmataceae bacterium]